MIIWRPPLSEDFKRRLNNRTPQEVQETHDNFLLLFKRASGKSLTKEEKEHLESLTKPPDWVTR